jgi:hypothetical protein
MALLSNRTSEEVAVQDENGDGWVDRSDDRIAAERGTSTTVIPPVSDRPTGKAQVDERLAAQRRLEARSAAATATLPRDDSEVLTTTPEGPRPRASFFATLSLMLGLAAALTVMTGVLAGPGVGLGLLATFAAIGGIAATSSRHVAGKGDALIGMALGLGAIVVGVLAITGNLPWLDTTNDQVMQVRDWLNAQAPWLFPSS